MIVSPLLGKETFGGSHTRTFPLGTHIPHTRPSQGESDGYVVPWEQGKRAQRAINVCPSLPSKGVMNDFLHSRPGR